MSQQTLAPAAQIVVRRTFAAPVERVYQAWTDPAQVAQWLFPNARWQAAIADMDTTVGGRRNVTMRHSDGDEFRTVGQYVEIVPNERLSFTWTWEDSPFGAEETLVTVEFQAVPDGTALTLTHDRVTHPQALEGLKDGWNGCLEMLNGYLAH